MPPRVQLLVSVRGATEALAALAGGADIIDVKEPSRGPLGMADPDVMKAVVEGVAGRALVSVAMGELRDNPSTHLIPPGVTFAKIGLAGARQGWQELLAMKFTLAPHVRPIAVAYEHFTSRNQPPTFDAIVEWAVAHNAHGVLVDTYEKKDKLDLFQAGPGMLLANASAYDDTVDQSMASTVRSVQNKDLVMALAGSLRGSSFKRALKIGPDIVGVRGAACLEDDRTAAIDAGRVRALADLIAAHNAQPAVIAG